jgi:hypothetical protein
MEEGHFFSAVNGISAKFSASSALTGSFFPSNHFP